jgi:hypothetical protein
MKTSRLPRPKTIHVDPVSLAKDLNELAKQKDPGFTWAGAEYTKASRSLSADVTGLSRFEKPLKVLLSQAPTGFPSHSSLRSTFLTLQESHNIFGELQPSQQFKIANHSADVWRIMCKDVYNLSKLKTIPPAAIALCNLIEKSTESPSKKAGEEMAGSGSDAFLDPATIDDMFPHMDESSSDAEIVEIRCRCQRCSERGNITKTTDEASCSPAAAAVQTATEDPTCAATGQKTTEDSACASAVDVKTTLEDSVCAGPLRTTSEASSSTVPIPHAARGGQRKQTDQSRGEVKKKPTKKKPTKKKPTKKKPTKKKPAAAAAAAAVPVNFTIKLPVQVVYRKSGNKIAETYIMQKDPKQYIAGHSEKRSTNHKENVEALFKAINEGSIHDKHGALSFLGMRL